MQQKAWPEELWENNVHWLIIKFYDLSEWAALNIALDA